MSEDSGEYTYEIVEPKAPIVDKPSDVLRVGFRHSNTDRFVPYLTALVRGHMETGSARIQIPIGAVPGITLPTSMETKLREAALAVMRGAVFYAELDADQFKKIWPFYTVIHDALADAIVIKLKREVKIAFNTTMADWTLRVDEPEFERKLTLLAELRTLNCYFGKVTILGMFDRLEEFTYKLPARTFQRVTNNEHVML